MKNWICAILIMSSAISYGQETIKMTAGGHNDYGLSYNLPTTMVSVEIVATKKIETRGPYYLYAEKYLGVKDVITKSQTSFSIDNIDITTFGQANANETYLVKFNAENPPSFYLTKEGQLLSINTEPSPLVSETKDSKLAGSNDGFDAFTALNEEQLSAGSTAKMAETAAKQIYRIRESRMNLVTGDVDQLPADGESFKIIMKQLDNQEKALTEMFIGKTVEKHVTEYIDINPIEWQEKSILFRFSKHLGLVDNDNLAGAPFYLKATTIKDLRPMSKEQISANLKRRAKNKGIAYYVPGTMKIEVSSNNKIVESKEIEVSQLGEIMQLPKSTFDNKKTTAKAIFNPETGAILEITQ